MSCSCIGLCKNKKNLQLKTIRIFTHQNHHLQEVITPMESCRNIGLGFIVTKHSTAIPTLSSCHSNTRRKVLKVEGQSPDFTITTNKNTYKTKVIVVTIGASNTFFNWRSNAICRAASKSLPKNKESNYTIPIIKLPTAYICSRNSCRMEKPTYHCRRKWWQLLQISLRFGIMVLKHMFTTALDKTIWLLENNVSFTFFTKLIMLSYLLGLTRLILFILFSFFSILFYIVSLFWVKKPLHEMHLYSVIL
jgi:hypothetical protein